MVRPFRSDRRWTFDVEPEALWTQLVSTDQYTRWWPWLRRFDGIELADGARWRCEVAPPLPYVVRFTIAFDAVEPPHSAVTMIDGDIKGWARLDLLGGPGRTTRARLQSSLRPANPVLVGFGLVARPLVAWGHDWVLDEGRRQFVNRGCS